MKKVPSGLARAMGSGASRSGGTCCAGITRCICARNRSATGKCSNKAAIREYALSSSGTNLIRDSRKVSTTLSWFFFNLTAPKFKSDNLRYFRGQFGHCSGQEIPLRRCDDFQFYLPTKITIKFLSNLEKSRSFASNTLFFDIYSLTFSPNDRKFVSLAAKSVSEFSSTSVA